MADESFEERVRRQLADMPMKPDPAVWHEVAAALQKERKSRWLIWFFLLLSVFTGISFWAYYQFSQPEQGTNGTITKTIILKVKPAQGELSALMINKNKMVTPQQPFTPGIIQTVNKKERHSTPYTAFPKDRHTKRVKTVVSAANDPINKGNQVILPANHSVLTIQMPDSIQSTAKALSNNALQTSTGTETDTVQVILMQPNREQVRLPVPKTVAGTTLDDEVKKIKTKKWQWNMDFEGGASGLRSSLFTTGKSLNFFYNSSAPALSTGSSGTTFQSLVPAPVIKDALSIGIHFQATRPIGKKHTIGISFGYNLFQTTTGVGRRVDSTIYFNSLGSYNTNGFYYNINDSINYKNQYHFLGLGVDVYTPVKLFKKVSLRWQLGTGFKVLFATNGLNYDAVSGSLLRNSELMRTVHTYFSTGIDMAIGKRPFLYIGPHWQYFVSNLSKKELTNQHFSLSAVKITFIIPQKKIKMQR